MNASILVNPDLLTNQSLEDQNRRFDGTGGVSEANRGYGFRPAFMDVSTGTVYLSRFANGSVAPMHVLDGLPQELVTHCTVTGRAKAVKGSVSAGFVRSGQFYTREQAAKAVCMEN